jgi:putative membrane protein
MKAGRLAGRMSEDREVKHFASAMIDEHKAMEQDVTALMQKKGMAIPSALPEDLKGTFKDLNQLMGKDFDRKYAGVNVDGHKDAVALFENVSANSKDADVKQLAAAALPKIKHHEEMATALLSEVNSTK